MPLILDSPSKTGSESELELDFDTLLPQQEEEGIEMVPLVYGGAASRTKRVRSSCKTSIRAECDGFLWKSPQLPASAGTLAALQYCPHRRAPKVTHLSQHPQRYITGRPVTDDVQVCAGVLGQGSHGTVRSATCLRTGQQLAVKTLWRANMSERAWQRAQQEARIHLSMDHPHIVRLHRVYDEGSVMHLVMERLEGGELFDRLHERRRFSEEETSDVARQVLRAVTYMHEQGVVHRDLKLENIMYVAKDSSHVKLIDLGFATHLRGEQRLQESCGSLQYMAPEILKRYYSEKVDVWSIGSIVYTLLIGVPLFKGPDREVLRKTAAGRPDFSKRLLHLSRGARDFIFSLLATNPTKRPSASEAARHTWLQAFAPTEVAAATKDAAAADGRRILLQHLHEYLLSPHPRRSRLSALVTWSLPAKNEVELCCSFNALADATCGMITPVSLRNAAAGYARLSGCEAEEEVLLLNDMARLLEDASSSSHGAVKEIAWSQLLAASLLSENVKLPGEDANSQASTPDVMEAIASCRVACGSRSHSGEHSGGSTRTGSLVDGVMPCPSLMDSTAEPAPCEMPHEIVPDKGIRLVSIDPNQVKFERRGHSAVRSQTWAYCWSPLNKLLFGGL